MYAIRYKAVPFIIGLLAVLLALCPLTGHAESDESETVMIKEWEIQWFNDKTPTSGFPSLDDPWLHVNVHKPTTTVPQGYNGAWIHVAIPPTSKWLTPGLLIEHMYGLHISVYEDGLLIYDSKRNSIFDRNTLLLALQSKPQSADLYIRIASIDRAGIVSAVHIGDFYELSESYNRKELPSLLLGASIAFLSILMLLISGYLKRQQRGAWVSLSLIALATSVLIIMYSTLPFIYFPEIGKILQFLFDTSMLVVFPALHFYVASIFDGKLIFFRRFGKWFAGYSVFGFLILILNGIIGESFFFYYKLFTFWLLAPMIFIHLLLVLSHSVIQSVRGNKDGIIVSLGFLALAVSGVADLATIYTSDTMPLVYRWKIGIVLLIVSLVIVLARKISADHQKLLAYSKELELFNHQLQRTEKLEFVSELAASIAHEVRNPLQVTRGFLQLISARSNEVNKTHFSMAINELDRASMIITDFLTFAKPELDSIVALNLKEELTTVETIMSPLAAINGAVFQVKVPDQLHILGNPSKLKQAFMNIIKNSIEALQDNGIIEIDAKEENSMAVIRIADNGEGMEKEQIARLGEPYFSTKTKGTGLGLMVTFRIIEVMNGTLEFRSEKGKGTEAWIRFPLTHPN
jgi:Signal transduction histidine kinase